MLSTPNKKNHLKIKVKKFWNDQSCGEVYATGKTDIEYYQSESKTRYELEPYIHRFAKFFEGKNKEILEVGVGMGTDHSEWAKSVPKLLKGIDLTSRAIEHTKKRFELLGFTSELQQADAENLPFKDESFDIVYSWGVLHHSPNTDSAINEVHRVLRTGGTTRVMIYHKYSLTGYMLWLRYALLRFRPFTSLKNIYFNHLESPGTKAYSKEEAKKLFSNFSDVKIKVQLNLGDLLEGSVGQRHTSILLSVAKKLWPRKLIKLLFKNHGLMLLIEAKK